MRFLILAAVLALGACKAHETRGENDSIKASTGLSPDSGPAPAPGPAANPGMGTTDSVADTTKGATKRP